MSGADLMRPHQWLSLQERPKKAGLYAVQFEDGPSIVIEYRGGWQFVEAATAADPWARGIIESNRAIRWREH